MVSKSSKWQRASATAALYWQTSNFTIMVFAMSYHLCAMVAIARSLLVWHVLYFATKVAFARCLPVRRLPYFSTLAPWWHLPTVCQYGICCILPSQRQGGICQQFAGSVFTIFRHLICARWLLPVVCQRGICHITSPLCQVAIANSSPIWHLPYFATLVPR